MKQTAYEVITGKIISLLENGVIPWRKPWRSSGKSPVNMISGKEYRGINRFILNSAGYSSPYWLTFRQAKAKGGGIRKGEKGMPVVYWKVVIKEEKDEKGEEKKVFICRYYTVFNITQTEGIEIPAVEPINVNIEPIEEAERIVSGMPNRPDITHNGESAYYRPSSDTINIPPKELFENSERYLSIII